jgi:hypothetical protein
MPSTRTGRREAGREDIQRRASSEMPPPGTIMWMCGWCVIADSHVWSTACGQSAVHASVSRVLRECQAPPLAKLSDGLPTREATDDPFCCDVAALVAEISARWQAC